MNIDTLVPVIEKMDFVLQLFEIVLEILNAVQMWPQGVLRDISSRCDIAIKYLLNDS